MRQQIARFLIAGVFGFIVDAGILYLGLAVGLGYFASRAISFLCAVWVTWQFNRRYTFHAEKQGSAWSEWWRYLAAMSMGGSANYATYSGVVLYFQPAPWLPACAIALGSLVGLVFNFASAKWLVFRRTSQL